MIAASGSPLPRFAVRLVATAAALTLANEARAETSPSITARLDYAADPTCPDEAALRSAVSERLGTDPFRDDARATVRARIARSDEGFSAEVAFDDAAGRHGERRLASKGEDCRELATTVALTIAIMVDPRTFGSSTPPPSPPPRAIPAAESPPASVEDPPREEPRAQAPEAPRTRLRFGGGPVLAVGSAPAPAVGLLLFGGVGFRGSSIDVEGRADLPASLERSSGVSISSSLLVGSVVPCLHLGNIRACALATAGAMMAEARGAASPDRRTTTFFGALGGRAGYELPVSRRFGLRARLDVAAPLTPTSLTIDGVTQWTTSPVTAAVGIDAVGEIP